MKFKKKAVLRSALNRPGIAIVMIVTLVVCVIWMMVARTPLQANTQLGTSVSSSPEATATAVQPQESAQAIPSMAEEVTESPTQLAPGESLDVIKVDPALTVRHVLRGNGPRPSPTVYPSDVTILTQPTGITYVQDLYYDNFLQPGHTFTITVTSPAEGIQSVKIQTVANPPKVTRNPGLYIFEYTNARVDNYAVNVLSKTKDVSISYTIQ